MGSTFVVPVLIFSRGLAGIEKSTRDSCTPYKQPISTPRRVAKDATINLDPELFCACRGERSHARIPKPLSIGDENDAMMPHPHHQLDPSAVMRERAPGTRLINSENWEKTMQMNQMTTDDHGLAFHANFFRAIIPQLSFQ